ncbi:nitric oxide reductase activation protein NorD [Methylophaga sulfidovorans]|uniref:von Willebrand factor type A domain-containing protein n=1 Tax=Methylophaga sulfidovorans TaxID=45496 RepID=A0A1I3UBT8_9GAMM|nr:VWA domain-containing protein [Methylophaga sulfidovorans]SFJ80460.1 von Willebrand factor type A domain-containing protein [Methylophaga sulfidovorans]
MGLRSLVRPWLRPPRDSNKLSLESRQTGSCGGMSTTELKIRIELILDGIDTNHIIEPVTKIAALSHALQSEFLTELAEVAELSVTHANALMRAYTPALNSMSRAEHSLWLEKIKHTLNEGHSDEASSLINNYSKFASTLDKSTVQLEEVSERLEKLIKSVTEKDLILSTIEESEIKRAYTDGNQLFVPSSISLFDHYDDNYLLLKVIIFQLLGQIQCDTILAKKRISQATSAKDNEFLEQFSIIETLRINHHLKKSFPGVWRNILHIHKLLDLPSYPEKMFSSDQQTSVFDSLDLIDQSDKKVSFPTPLPYMSDFSARAFSLFEVDVEADQSVLMNVQLDNNDLKETFTEDDKAADRITLRHNASAAPVYQSGDAKTDIWSQLDETVKQYQQQQESLRDENKQNVYLYPEWDASLKQYRQNWCRVEEIAITANNPSQQSLDIADTRFSEYKIKKTLDKVINNQKLMRHQDDGEDIDIDAWVEASSNKIKQADDFQRLYIRNNKNTRSIAIMFAVDISGSTSGWKNRIIQQSTWLLSRTLSKLDDQFAIYAFSGVGREKCDIYPVKRFDENYSNTIKQRITDLSAKQYTRMGAAIRHLSKVLSQADAKTKILFVLTDGRPDDIDSYRGNYGVEDTRRAFNEAKALYLNPFVLTFDQEAMDYLPYMLGKNRYKLISDISMLPVQISTIYKQLTT